MQAGCGVVGAAVSNQCVALTKTYYNIAWPGSASGTEEPTPQLESRTAGVVRQGIVSYPRIRQRYDSLRKKSLRTAPRVFLPARSGC